MLDWLQAMHTKHRAYLSGTTVVVIRTPGEMVIGADSIVVAKTEFGSYGETMCKIIPVGNLVFFAAAGLIGDSDGVFNAYQIALECGNVSRRTLDTVNSFESAVKPPLIAALEDIRQKAIGPVINNTRALETVFISLENDVLSYHLSNFILTLDEANLISLDLKRVNCPPDCKDGVGLSTLGLTTHIAEYFPRNHSRADLPTVDKAELVRQLIQLEIDNAADGEVGGTIVILRLTQGGAQWIRNEGVSPDLIAKGKRHKTAKTRVRPRRR
ncbi:MAG: hypothetical protein AABO57_13260 [Acidobacteriota bacterium]